jgi:hypothetical protein
MTFRIKLGERLLCPVCEHELSILASSLAETELGTQCSRCWSRVARLRTSKRSDFDD